MNLGLVKDVFRAGLERLASRPESSAKRARAFARLRNSLFKALQSAPMDADPVMKMKLRATIAAGFDAAVREVRQRRKRRFARG
jgi:hypothetical protein